MLTIEWTMNSRFDHFKNDLIVMRIFLLTRSRDCQRQHHSQHLTRVL